MNEWVRTREWRGSMGTLDYIESLGGIDWADAPLPYPWHRCMAQTRGWIGLTEVIRCACGATYLGNGRWMDKNQTRKHRRRDRRIAQARRIFVNCHACGKPYETSALAPDAGGLCNDCWADQLISEHEAR